MAAPVLIFSANVQKTQKIIINFERQLGFLLQDRNLKHIYYVLLYGDTDDGQTDRRKHGNETFSTSCQDGFSNY